jgi:hypothetical protein
MKWCHQRQMFQQIQSGTYSKRSTANLLSVWSAELTSIYNVEVHLPATDKCVSLDWGPIEVAMYDGLTNARKYGLQSTKPWVEVEFADTEDELIIRVCNVADPNSPDITCEDALRFCSGEKGSYHSSGSEVLSDHLQLSDGVGMSNAMKAAQVDPSRDLNPNHSSEACPSPTLTTNPIPIPDPYP